MKCLELKCVSHFAFLYYENEFGYCVYKVFTKYAWNQMNMIQTLEYKCKKLLIVQAV